LPNTSAFFALTLPRARRIPWIIHWHADVDSTFNKLLSLAYFSYRPLEQYLLSKAKRIIVTSPPYLASSRALQPWRDKCQVIPLGIAPSRLLEPIPTARQWAEQQWQVGKVRILSIGRLTYYKGHEILLHAMAHVQGAQAIIIGKGEQQPVLQALIHQLHLGQQVKLFGYCTNEELTALLATCDIFCLPSLERAEAFGVVLLEAMRYEKAIVASAILGSGTTWVIEDSQTGMGVPPHNIPALTQALQQLIDNPTLRTNLGKAGHQRLLQRFDIIKVAEEIATMYQLLGSVQD
jgi:rhamnosyl/mannosyltransferase